MMRKRQIFTVILLSAVLGTGCSFGSGTGLNTEEQSDANSDIFFGISEEQKELMGEYELMEAEDDIEHIEGEAEATAEDEVYTESDNGTLEDIQEEQGTEELSIIMVGDILLHTPVEEAAYDESEQKYNFDFIFANTKDEIEGADIAIVNEEVIIGGTGLGISGYPAFNAPYEIGDALVKTGFDVICHATNHALDKGAKGILNCTDYWEEISEKYPDITMVGIHESEEDAEEIELIDKNGITLAILNYTYGTNGIPLPADMPYAVDMLDEEKVVKDLKRAEEMADFTIVIPHWGTEYSLEATGYQKKWAALMAQNGADLIIGAHPHVIEPVEWIDGSVLCYYSLGNFVNWTSGTGTGVANRMVGGMADVRIKKDADGKVNIEDYGIIPLVCHVQSGREGVTVYRFDEYNSELALVNEINKQDSAFDYEYCNELIHRVWGDLIE